MPEQSPDQVADQSTTPPQAPLAARIGLILGPLLLLLTWLTPAPGDMPDSAWLCVGLALLMATWWATEALPIPVTSLLPIVLVPALGIDDIKSTTAAYANPTIYLFLGGFLLGIAMQRWDLHRRVALHTLKLAGHSPRRQIAGFMIATGFISMWVSNTATSIMMLPIGMSVISLMSSGQDERDSNDPELKRYAAALLLGIAYSASLGGIATLIGTPPNALLAGYLSSDQGIEIGFAQWMVVGLPVAIAMCAITWWWLTRTPFSFKSETADSGEMISRELKALGAMSSAEKRVGVAFLVAALLWMFRPLINQMGLAWLSDTGIAMAIGVGLFAIPSGTSRGRRLLVWEDARDLPWGVLLLFGGGLALAGVIKSSGLAEWIAGQLSMFSVLPLIGLVAIVVVVIIFLTEVTSNTATAAAFLPLLGALALSLDIDPLLITVPAAIAASCAFMMPVATPPNAIVFATGHLKIQTMMRAGFFLNLAGTVVVTLLAYGLIVALWV
ncbi:SLC13 family permease [Cobetia amphilecti]|uniref:SLC13 family permease n=1 Tax=Cobetia amphilecti TaxID=1055104 RepID=A0ABT6UQL6_9GAMM|nr:SLC13 family permease [Cobetia amphilecti]MDI5884640.1 SLC13 family permease [Cobetia amphilecti]WOI25190.1 SLC13 family permease [Cobetia amphilecti]